MKLLKMRMTDDRRIQALVDHIPTREELVYESLNGYYFAEKEGFVDFLYYTEPGTGFGGAKFTLKMKDGTVAELIGPWRTSSMSIYENTDFPFCVEASVTDDPATFESRGGVYIAGALTVDAVNEFLGREGNIL